MAKPADTRTTAASGGAKGAAKTSAARRSTPQGSATQSGGQSARKGAAGSTEERSAPSAAAGTTTDATSGSAAGGRATPKSAPAKNVTAKSAAGKRAATKTAGKTAAKGSGGKSGGVRSATVTNAPAKSGSKAGAVTGEAPPKRTRSAADTERIRAALQERRAELREEYDQHLAEIAELQRDRLTDSAGDDQADTGSKTFEREQEISLANSILERITQVERALERLAEGSYGWCERCGSAIPVERLAAFPSATLCVRCKQLEERR